MATENKAITIQSLNSSGGVRESRAGVSASFEVVDGKEKWAIPVSERGFEPKAGDRIIPIGGKDRKPRTVTAVSEVDGKYQLICDVPPKE